MLFLPFPVGEVNEGTDFLRARTDNGSLRSLRRGGTQAELCVYINSQLDAKN